MRGCCARPTSTSNGRMRQDQTRIIDTEAREFPTLWWCRMIPERSFVRGWKIGPSHFINQDLSNIWLDEGPAG